MLSLAVTAGSSDQPRAVIQDTNKHSLRSKTPESLNSDRSGTLRTGFTVVAKLTRRFLDVQSLFRKSFALDSELRGTSGSQYTTILTQRAIVSRSKSHTAEVLSLRGSRAEEAIDQLQRVLDENVSDDGIPTLQQDHRIELRHLLVRLSKAAGVLPSFMFLQNVQCIDRESVAGGAFADIFVAVYQGQQVALKRHRTFLAGRAEADTYNAAFCREALVWKQLCHPNVLSFLGVDRDNFKSCLCMVSPWMPEGNIMECLRRLSGEGQNIPIERWLREIIEGLQYLHSETIIHGDLRGANVLIDSQLHVKLADFGLSQFADSTTASLGSHIGGAVRWLAPEVINGGRPTFASDIYAFGCVCLEIITRKHPFPEIQTDAKVVAHMIKGGRPKKPPLSNPAALWDLVERCWMEDPTDRPPAKFIVDSFPAKDEMEFIGSGYDIIFDSETLCNDVRSTRSTQSFRSGSSKDRPWSPFSLLGSSPAASERHPKSRNISTNSSFISLAHSQSSLLSSSGPAGFMMSTPPMQGVPISNPFSVDSSPEYSSPKARKGHPLLIPDDILEEGGLDEYLMEAEGTKTPIKDTKRHVFPNEARFNPSKPSEETLFLPPLNLPFIPSGVSEHDNPHQELPSEFSIPKDPLSDLKRQMADGAESVSII